MADQRLNIIFSGDASQLDAAIKKLTEDIALLEKQLSDLQSKQITAGITVDTSQLQEQLNAAKAKLAELKDQKILISGDTSAVTAEIEQLKTKLAGLEAQIPLTVTGEGLDKLNVDIANVKSEIESLSGKQIVISSDITDPQIKIETLKTELNSIEGKGIVVSADITDVQNKIGVVDSELNSVSGKEVVIGADTSDVIRKVETAKTEISELKTTPIVLTGDAAQLNKTVAQSAIRLKELNTQLKGVGASAFDQATAGVAKFDSKLTGLTTGSIAQLRRAVTLLKTELANLSPAALQAPLGKGLSDSLAIVTTELKALEKQALITGTATSGVFNKAFQGVKQLANIIPGLGIAGIFGLAISAIQPLIDGLFNIGDAANDAKSSVASLNEVLSESAASVQGEAAKVGALVKAATGTASSFTVQKNAIAELQKINKSYFGDLTAGKSTYEEITKAANAYTEALVNQAIINGLSNAISKLSEEYGNLFIKYQDQTKAATIARKELDKTTAANRTNVQGMTAQNREVNLATNNFNKLQGELGTTGQQLAKISTRIQEFTSQIQSAVGIQLKLKPIDVTKIAPAKNETDDILERARLFVKEFKDTFILPDLEITFFKNKDAVLKEAKKLLDDIAKGSLQIKIPVLTDFEFIPDTSDIKPLTEEQLKPITDRFLKDFQLEHGINVDVPVQFDFTLPNKDQQQQLDTLLKGFSQLGTLGFKEFEKINFSNFNKGLEEGTKRLQDMMAIATTLNSAIGQGLVNAFNNVFDAVLEGKNVFKVLGNAIKELIVGTIKAIAQMLILRAVTSFFLPGLPVPQLIGGVHRGLVHSAAPSFGGGIGGGISVNITGQLTGRGSDLVGVISQGSLQIGRVG
jgi:hypothetical protein